MRSFPGSRFAASRNGPSGGTGALGRPRPTRGDDVQEERRVRHRPRDAAVHGHPQPVALRADRDAVALGLQPEEPAVRRRVADRAGPVGGVGERDHPGRDGARAAPAGPAGRALGVPRVPGDAEGLRLGVAVDRELGQVGLADHDRARPAQPRNQLGVALGHQVERRGAVGGDLPLDPLVPVVLDRDGDPEQRGLLAGGQPARRRPSPRPALSPRARPGRRSARGSRRSIRSRNRSVSSSGETSFARTISASRAAPAKARSSARVHRRHPSASSASPAARSPLWTAPSM